MYAPVLLLEAFSARTILYLVGCAVVFLSPDYSKVHWPPFLKTIRFIRSRYQGATLFVHIRSCFRIREPATLLSQYMHTVVAYFKIMPLTMVSEHMALMLDVLSCFVLSTTCNKIACALTVDAELKNILLLSVMTGCTD